MAATPRELVRDVVALAAPSELSILDGFDQLSDEQVTAIVTRRRAGGDPLGFGAGEVTALVTPVVWLVVHETTKRGAGIVAEGLLGRLRSLLRRLLRRPAAPRTVPPLSPEQLEAVHARTLEQAVQAGIDDQTAAALADAIVSRLARAAANPGAAAGPDSEPEPGDTPTT